MSRRHKIQVCNLSPNLILLEILYVAVPFTSIYLLDQKKREWKENGNTFLESFFIIIIYHLFLCCFFFWFYIFTFWKRVWLYFLHFHLYTHYTLNFIFLTESYFHYYFRISFVRLRWIKNIYTNSTSGLSICKKCITELMVLLFFRQWDENRTKLCDLTKKLKRTASIHTWERIHLQ